LELGIAEDEAKRDNNFMQEEEVPKKAVNLKLTDKKPRII
jgi:hypothetical protein